MEFIFQRGGEELTLEIQQEIATAEFLVVWHQSDGSTRTERFGDQEGAVAYVEFLERRLLGEKWTRAETHQRPRGNIRAVPLPAETPDEAPPTTLNGRLLTMRVTTAPPPSAPPEMGDTHEEEAESSSAPDSSADWRGSARYSLERSLICPHCHELMQSIKVIRLVRSQVPFTSTLPRRGRVLTCPGCDTILSAEL
jgi:hypothetical protein